MKKIWLAILGMTVMTTAAMAAEQNPFHLYNRLRLGYEDNIYQVSSDIGETDSFRIVDEIEALLNLNYGHTYLAIRYRPSIIWYENRKDDDTDILHDLVFDFNHKFSETLSLDLSDTLRAGQLPELHDGDYVVREDDDNYYNSALATLMYQMTPKTRLDLSGRFITLNYTSDSPAKDYSDYISPVAGLTLRQTLSSLSSGMIDVRYQALRYSKNPDGFDRDADMIFAGVGYEQTISRYFIGSLRGGAEQRMYKEDDYDDNTQPYVEAALTFMPVEDFRTTLSGSYSIYESDIANYMSQDRAYVSLSAAWDITRKLSAYASAAYTRSAYDADYAKHIPELEDGVENAYVGSARLSYQIGRKNWLELNYQYLKLDSDIKGRQSYDDNRIDLAWRIQLL